MTGTRLTMRIAWVVAVLWATWASAPAGPAARDVADTDVDRAIGEARRFLYGQQQGDGHFRHYWRNVPRGGNTAIALFALLEAGEPTSDERIVRGLDALANLETNNLYVIATRVMVLSRVAKVARYRTQLGKDIRYLTRNALRAGAWGYGGPQRTGDNSCSQFALLALWEADRAGVRINPGLIRRVQTTWLRRQRRDGGWTYSGQPDVDTDSTISMTAAAVASLYICQDVLTTTCVPYRHQRKADSAWAYLARNLKADYHKNGYLAFCVQRVGMASGRKFVAGMDWFATGAAKL
ncbi:MAG: prenyltransferase/squalene oxidase repeat-containing protein, partial [Planctomycetota bacterium]